MEMSKVKGEIQMHATNKHHIIRLYSSNII